MDRFSHPGLSLVAAAVVLGGAHGARHNPRGICIRQRCDSAMVLRPTRTLHAHSATVHSLAYSPDGELIASSGEDGTAKLWVARTGRCLRTLPVSTRCLAFSPDGRWLATGSYDVNLGAAAYDFPKSRLVKIWSVHSGRVVRQLAGHREPVQCVGWAPKSRLIAAGGSDGSVMLWEAGTWRRVATLRESFSDVGKGDHVTAKQSIFSPDGKTLAVVSVAEYQGEPGSAKTRVVLWGAGTHRRQHMLLDQPDRWNAIGAFTGDSRRLVAATEGFPSGGEVYMWDLPTGRRRTMAEGEDASYGAALVPPGRWFAAGGKEWTAFLLDLRVGNIVARLPHPTAVTAMAGSPDGRTLVTGDASGVIRFWRMPLPAQRVRPLGIKAAGAPKRR